MTNRLIRIRSILTRWLLWHVALCMKQGLNMRLGHKELARYLRAMSLLIRKAHPADKARLEGEMKKVREAFAEIEKQREHSELPACQ